MAASDGPREAYRLILRHLRRAETEIDAARHVVESAPSVSEGYFLPEMERILEGIRGVMQRSETELDRLRRS